MSSQQTRTPNFRSLLPLESDYVDFNREERHFSALLFHLLLQPGGAEKFLELVRVPYPVTEPQVFFEFTELRDRFAAIARDCAPTDPRREILRDAIVKMLAAPQSFGSRLMRESPQAFNTHFCNPRGVSSDHYQMPSRWSPKHNFDSWYDIDQEFAKRACKMAWAFNAKPDLVIKTSENTVVCVEIKVESGEGAYKVDSKRLGGAFRSRQLEIQRHALEELLGYTAHFVFLSPLDRSAISAPQGTDFCVSWREVIRELATTAERPFVQRMLESAFLQGKKPEGARD